MSVLPPDESQLIVQKTDLQPVKSEDSATTWQTFVDALRGAIGLKPLYLIERFAVARVRQEEARGRQEEVDAEAKLYIAKAQYELAMARAKSIEMGAEGKLAKDLADAELVHAQIKLFGVSESLVEQLLQAKKRNPAEALNDLNDVIERIKLHGGSVEIDLGDSESTETEDQ